MILNGSIIDKQPYIIIKQAVPADVCALLADYTRFKAHIKPNIKKNIDPLDNVHREYGDPMMELLLDKLTPIVEKATGVELWPTLSFYYLYANGNQLRKHKDRSSCQWVAGLCIGADDAFKKDKGSWPLILTTHAHHEPISLEMGDLLIFQGHEIEHWREIFTGNWFSSAIFGYVDKHGPFAFQKYDQRSALGKPHVGMFRWAFTTFMHRYFFRQ